MEKPNFTRDKNNYDVKSEDNVIYINARRNKKPTFFKKNTTNKQIDNKKPTTKNPNYNKQPAKPLVNGNAEYLSKIDFTNIEQIITQIIEQFKVNNLEKLHRIDEKLLEEAIINYRKDLAELAIIAYSLRKLASKKHILLNPNWNFFKEEILSDLMIAINLNKEKDKKNYDIKITNIQDSIKKTDKLFGYFVQNIIFNARAKIASTAYAYGLSLSQATNLLSADKDQVMAIVGQTKISDEDLKDRTISDRVNNLKKIILEEKRKSK